MSNIHDQIKEKADQAAKAEEIAQFKLEQRYQQHQVEKARTNQRDNAVISMTDTASVESSLLAMRRSIESIKNRFTLLPAEFQDVIYFAAGELNLILGPTGQGKSLVIANLAAAALHSPKKPRILVLTNELAEFEVFMRVYALLSHKNHFDHDLWSETDFALVAALMRKYKASGHLQCFSKNYPFPGATYTADGLIRILTAVANDPNPPDAIILDYYQGIISNGDEEAWKEQEKLVSFLENYRETFQGSVTVLAQVQLADSDNFFRFQSRFEGRKSIANRATSILELTGDHENQTTKWYSHKSRRGKSHFEFYTAYFKGQFCGRADVRPEVQKIFVDLDIKLAAVVAEKQKKRRPRASFSEVDRFLGGK